VIDPLFLLTLTSEVKISQAGLKFSVSQCNYLPDLCQTLYETNTAIIRLTHATSLDYSYCFVTWDALY